MVPKTSAGLSRRMILLFAVSGGVAVGNLYWAQPLLQNIAQAFGASPSSAGLLVTVTQIGYTFGVLLILPLGDTLNRRILIPAVMGSSVLALAASAFAPSFFILMATLSAVGLTTVTGQLLVPLAGDLAHGDQRGRVVGTVVSGILSGILASRTISGLLADAFGWRTIYVVAAAVTFVLAILLAAVIPALPPRERIPYGKLLVSIVRSVREHRSVQVTLILSAIAFSVLTMFWTALTFLLSAPPFMFSVTKIGLVGLIGLAGAVLSQTRVLSVDPAARSRLNTALVAFNFVGGALGSAVAGVLWQVSGWMAVMTAAGALIGLALFIWASQRHRFRAVGRGVDETAEK